MLNTASDYRFVDVSDINITGDIWPNHRGEAQYKHPLKAEDIAFIYEGVLERQLYYNSQIKSKIGKALSPSYITGESPILSLKTFCKECISRWVFNGYLGSKSFIPHPEPRYGIHDFDGLLVKELGFDRGVRFSLETPSISPSQRIDIDILDAAYRDLNKLIYVAGDASTQYYSSGPLNHMKCSGEFKVRYDKKSYVGEFSEERFRSSIVEPRLYTVLTQPSYSYLEASSSSGSPWVEETEVKISSLKGKILIKPDESPIIGVNRMGIGLDYYCFTDEGFYRKIVWDNNIHCSSETNEFTVPTDYLSTSYMRDKVFEDVSFGTHYSFQLENVYYWAEPDFKALT